tara:strand:+ start:71 stop:445 length:375 start_codon:yes stop_codon:yes gene_type:complete
MRNFLIISLPIFLSSCAYGSLYEAKSTCNDWASEGGNYTGFIKAIPRTEKNKNLNKEQFVDTVNNFPIRKCLNEPQTNKILGLEVKNREANKSYRIPEGRRLQNNPKTIVDINLNWEVDKKFRY